MLARFARRSLVGWWVVGRGMFCRERGIVGAFPLTWNTHYPHKGAFHVWRVQIRSIFPSVYAKIVYPDFPSVVNMRENRGNAHVIPGTPYDTGVPSFDQSRTVCSEILQSWRKKDVGRENGVLGRRAALRLGKRHLVLVGKWGWGECLSKRGRPTEHVRRPVQVVRVNPQPPARSCLYGGIRGQKRGMLAGGG